MKYIRTKDGRIIDYYEWRANEDKYEIVRNADTIEELCDEFVLITYDEEVNKRDNVRLKKHIFMRGQNGLSFSITEKDDKKCGYYGAILTDKGLIYVAKMNEKGELELL